jgi:hypothetical protein
MLRRSPVQIRHAYDLVRRRTVTALEAFHRAGSPYFTDEHLNKRLVLVRSTEKTPHFRRLPARCGLPPRTALAAATSHQRAVRRLHLELFTGEGLTVNFHDGTSVVETDHPLIRADDLVTIAVEHRMTLAGRVFSPDILVLCKLTGQPILAVEICASHPIGPAKRAAYDVAGLPWIEVRAAHTCQRFRRRPLCAENWGGPKFPAPPFQTILWPAIDQAKVEAPALLPKSGCFAGSQDCLRRPISRRSPVFRRRLRRHARLAVHVLRKPAPVRIGQTVRLRYRHAV